MAVYFTTFLACHFFISSHREDDNKMETSRARYDYSPIIHVTA